MKLEKNEIRRWVADGHEFTSGDEMEVHIGEQWVRGRVEYLHWCEEYQLIVSSGLDTETYVVLHAGMLARKAGQKIRPNYP